MWCSVVFIQCTRVETIQQKCSWVRNTRFGTSTRVNSASFLSRSFSHQSLPAVYLTICTVSCSGGIATVSVPLHEVDLLGLGG